MAIKNVLSFPEYSNILQDMSVSVQMEDPTLPGILQDINDTLLATPNGVGLAAPQIGVLKRIFVLKKEYIIDDLAKDSIFLQTDSNVLFFINPKIVSAKGFICDDEGCLSVPGKYIYIERAKIVKVRALDEQGNQIYEKFKGLAARAIQQEIDHLNGVLILDHEGDWNG